MRVLVQRWRIWRTEPAQMGAHFDARWFLAGAHYDGDGTRALGVVDMIGKKQRSSYGVEERGWIPTRGETPSTASVPQQKSGSIPYPAFCSVSKGQDGSARRNIEPVQ